MGLTGAGREGGAQSRAAGGSAHAPRYRCVVFDLDDTLYLERDYVCSGFRAVGAWVQERWGEARFAQVAWGHFLQGVRGTIFNRALDSLGLPADPEVISEAVRVYREHVPDIALLPDARECLDRLRGRAFLGVITDGPLASQQRKAEALGLPRLVDHIIYTAELGEGFGKPHPRPFEEMPHRAGVSPEACVYLADNPQKDFIGPSQLGWGTVRVVREGGIYAGVEGPEGQDAEWRVGGLLEAMQRLSE